MEYHAFGIISEGRKSGCHYMICGVQGDFTKNLVTNPPKTVWTRELKFAGVGHASAMFKRGIRICTGTGIGAALSTCIQSENWFFIWIGSDQEKTFGPTISRLIHDNIPPERMILWDSKKRGGRPDCMDLLKTTYKSFGAEVIFITSNMQGNDEMMQGCREGMSRLHCERLSSLNIQQLGWMPSARYGIFKRFFHSAMLLCISMHLRIAMHSTSWTMILGLDARCMGARLASTRPLNDRYERCHGGTCIFMKWRREKPVDGLECCEQLGSIHARCWGVWRHYL